MTDTSYSLIPINGRDLVHASLPATFAPSHRHRSNPPAVESLPEDDGLITCFCGYSDDDGATVACDACNRWQHISCYYPDLVDALPEDTQHFCVECRPRKVDVEGANLLQTQKRNPADNLSNGVKRGASKSHKKKIKEPVANGWPLEKSRHDRNSDSPRDHHPPPAKRPKTSHRHSDSTTHTSTKGHSRKRNASTVNHRRSLSRSPDAAIDKYSEEFLQCHLEDDWVVTRANCLQSLDISREMSAWLNATDAEFRDTHSYEKHDVLMRWDQDLEDIPGKAETEIVPDQDETVVYENNHPTWKTVMVREPIAAGAYIGELIGKVGLKHDYQAEPANRWGQIRHPEPFVFFHPMLPICIDAREEGTELRYVRRSCSPNARLQVLVTGNTTYHFCFMATTHIEPGDEVAVGWDIADGLPQLQGRKDMSTEHMAILSDWVSGVLSNCGPCACHLPEAECKMARFDRRNLDRQDDLPLMKLPKAKRRKAGPHISPLNTHALNSRSGSEARRIDPDDDATDSRSVSASAGRGSASRDITPNTHYSHNGLSATTEMSERERKKLAKEEEMFRRQEEEQTGRQAKKKRSSAGSTANTPGATSTKTPSFPGGATSRYADAGTSRQTGLAAKSTLSRKVRTSKSAVRPVGRPQKHANPQYADAATQCDLDQEEAEQRSRALTPPKTFISTRQRLLELCARNSRIVKSSKLARSVSSPEEIAIVPEHPEGEDIKQEGPSLTSGATDPAQQSSLDVPTPHDDAITEDAATVRVGNPAPPPEETRSPSLLDASTSKAASPAISPKSPWSGTNAANLPSAHAHKAVNMHLQMPPPPSQFAGLTGPLSATTPNSIAGPIVQSPASLTGGGLAIFPPSVTAAVTPSPAKKKLSLSDYTRRNKANKENEAKVERESSPASVASGPIAPSLVSASPGETRAGVDGGPAMDDDVKMEDAPQPPATTA